MSKPKSNNSKQPSTMLYDGLLNNGNFHWSCLQKDCPQNCCGPNFEGYSSKGTSLFNVHHYAIILTPQDKERLEATIGQEYIETIDGRNYLKFKDDDSCFFLREDGMCKIHNIRPTGCRIFPLFLDKYFGVHVASSLCPGVGQGWTSKSELITMLHNLVNLVDYQTDEIKQLIKKLSDDTEL